MTKFLILLPLLFCTACATGPYPGYNSWTMSIPAVSRTMSVPPQKYTSLGNVREKFCTSEGKLTTRIGIVDALTARAQIKTKADYIINASFKPVNDYCVQLIGEAVKVGNGSAEVREAPAKVAPSAVPKKEQSDDEPLDL